MWDWKFSALIRKRFLLFFNTFGPKISNFTKMEIFRKEISNPTIMEKFHNWLWSKKWQIHVKLGYKNWRNVYLGHYCRVNFLFRGVNESGWRGVRSLLKPSSAFLINKIYQFFSKPAKKFADGAKPATRGGFKLGIFPKIWHFLIKLVFSKNLAFFN